MVRVITIAGTHSGVGKTSMTLGILRALKRRGLQVQPFKIGPDFIDPSHHHLAAGQTSHNLDGWLLSCPINQKVFWDNAHDQDVAIIEGVMGLFDGYGARSEAGSTAEMAKWIGSPVLLVIDASSLGRSAAALIQGYTQFDPAVAVVGVICNRVAGASHLDRIREATSDLPVEILGGIPRDSTVTIHERHLGLWMPEGDNLGTHYLEQLANLIETHIDLDRLLDLAAPLLAPDLPRSPQVAQPAAPVRIGIARDPAFCFYYTKNLDLIKQAGAELIPFSPLQDPLPSQLDGLYLGGGYPELYARDLSQNHLLLESIRSFSYAGGPIYGECGGLMYLSQGIETAAGDRYPLAGIFSFWTRMASKLKLGYTEVDITASHCLFPVGQIARGHRFHYSEMVEVGSYDPTHISTHNQGDDPEPGRFEAQFSHKGTVDHVERCYQISGWRRDREPEGYQVRQTLASYVHLHFASNPEFAVAFVQRCRDYQNRDPDPAQLSRYD